MVSVYGFRRGEPGLDDVFLKTDNDVGAGTAAVEALLFLFQFLDLQIGDLCLIARDLGQHVAVADLVDDINGYGFLYILGV